MNWVSKSLLLSLALTVPSIGQSYAAPPQSPARPKPTQPSPAPDKAAPVKPNPVQTVPAKAVPAKATPARTAPPPPAPPAEKPDDSLVLRIRRLPPAIQRTREYEGALIRLHQRALRYEQARNPEEAKWKKGVENLSFDSMTGRPQGIYLFMIKY